MAQNTIEILIKATDQATGAIHKAAGELTSQFDALGKTVLKVGAGAALGGLAALGSGMGVAIHEAMDAEVNIAKLNAVIKATGGAAGLSADQVLDMADTLSTVTRYSDDAILSGQTMLLTFTNIGEETFPRATETMLDMSEMFGGIETASVMLGKALNDPIQGVTALRRVGVQLTDEQEKIIKRLVETGDMAGAQAVILDELQRQFGGVAKAAGETLSGKLTILKNRLLNVAEAIGMKVLPPISRLVDKYLLPGAVRVGQMAEALSKAAGYMRMFGADSESAGFILQSIFGEGIGRAIQSVIVAVEKVANAFRGLITETIVPFVSKHAEEFKGALIAIGAVLAGAAIFSGIMAIGGAIGMLIGSLTGVGGLVAAVALLGAAWAGDWGGIRSFVTDTVWPRLKPVFDEIKTWLEEIIPTATDTLRASFENLKSAFEAGGLGAVGQLIVDSLKVGAGVIYNWVMDKIVTPLANTLKAVDWGARLAAAGQFIIDGLTLGAGVIYNWVMDKIVTPLANTLKAVDWGAHLAAAGDILQIIVDGLAQTAVDFARWVRINIVYPIAEWLQAQDWAGVLATGESVLGKIMGAIGGAWDGFKTWVKDNIITPIANKLGGITAADWIGANVEIGNVITKILEAIAGGVADVATVFVPWVWKNIIKPIGEALINVETWKTALATVGGILLGEILVATTVTVWAIEKLGEIARALINAVPSAATALADFGKQLANTVWEAIKEEVTGWPGRIADMLLGGSGGAAYGGMLHSGEPGTYVGLGAGRVWVGAGPAPAGRQHGGSVYAGKSYLVGERGPETFVPSTSGVIIPSGRDGNSIVIQGDVHLHGVQNPAQLLDALEREAGRRNMRLTTARA